MSLFLTMLALVALVLVGLSVVRPKVVFQYPIAVGFLVLGWLVPQARVTEGRDLVGAIDLSIVWGYMLICVLAIVVGFWKGRGGTEEAVGRGSDESLYRFAHAKMGYACFALTVVGAVAFAFMSRGAESQGLQWTGVISLYALLAQCLVYSATLSWLLYLRTGNKRILVLTIVAVAIFIPVVLFAVKRSSAFELAIIYFLGLYFVRGKVPSRAAIVIGAIIGTVLIHQVGELRNYIKSNDASVIEAVMDGAATRNFSLLEMERAPEVAGAAVDIYYTEKDGSYRPFAAMWNGLVHQYVPAFLVGEEFKAKLKLDESVQDAMFFSLGVTRTGFSDSFRAFWYFGALCFFAIAWGFGRLWTGATAGDLRYQFYYIILLNDGLIAVTESISRFIATLPFLLVATWLPFYVARREALSGRVPAPLPAGLGAR